MCLRDYNLPQNETISKLSHIHVDDEMFSGSRGFLLLLVKSRSGKVADFLVAN